MNSHLALLLGALGLAASASIANGEQLARQPGVQTGEQAGEQTREQTGERIGEQHPANASVSDEDRHFLQMSVDRGAREVQLSQRALKKTDNPGVQQFARQMIDDHSALNRQALSLSGKILAGGGPPETRVDPLVQREIAELDRLNGVEFDRRYMEFMIRDHAAGIEEARREAASGQDPELRALADRMLPILQAHLRMARETANALGK